MQPEKKKRISSLPLTNFQVVNVRGGIIDGPGSIQVPGTRQTSVCDNGTHSGLQDRVA